MWCQSKQSCDPKQILCESRDSCGFLYLFPTHPKSGPDMARSKTWAGFNQNLSLLRNLTPYGKERNRVMEYVYGISDSCKMQYALANIRTAHCTIMFSAPLNLPPLDHIVYQFTCYTVLHIVRQCHSITVLRGVTQCYSNTKLVNTPGYLHSLNWPSPKQDCVHTPCTAEIQKKTTCEKQQKYL